MRKLIAVVACAAPALLPGSALGKAPTKVYRGTFEAVGASTSGKFGKAQLVDGKRNDKLSVHVRRLAGAAQYVFRLQQGPAACGQGTDVPGWSYRRDGALDPSHTGNANSWARSHSFTATNDVEYFVGVYTATASGQPGGLVLCAKLVAKGHGGKHKPKRRGDTKHPPKPKPPHPHAF